MTGDAVGAVVEWVSTEWIPTPRVALTVSALTLVYASAAAAWVGRLHVRRGMATAYTRKVFHLLIFTAASAVHLYWGRPAVAVFGSVVAGLVLVAVWRGGTSPFYEALARPSDVPRRTLFILVPLVSTAVGGVLANLLFPQFAYVGYVVCGWGDAVAEPVGKRWGRHPYSVPSLGGVPAERTLEGSLSVAVVGTAAASLALVAGTGLSPGAALGVGAASGLAAAAVEAVSNHGLDNLTVQLAGALVPVLLI